VLYPALAGDAKGVCVIHAKNALLEVISQFGHGHLRIKKGGVQALSFHRSQITVSQAECPSASSSRESQAIETMKRLRPLKPSLDC
jgi:hypothetical protein